MLKQFLLARPTRALGAGPRTEGGPETLCTSLETGKDFFIWIRCNPLKSPDSDE
jgi:hypothetical protein